MTIVQNIFSFVIRAPKYIRGVYYRLLIIIAGGKCGVNLLVDRGFIFKHSPHRGIHVGRNVYFGYNMQIDVPPSGKLIIGNNVGLTGFSIISAATLVEIGSDTIIGEFCSIRDANHGVLKSDIIRVQPMESGELKIGSNVWIGRGCAILRGSEISNNSIVGANSIVNKKFEENAILLGTPAKLIRKR